MYLNNLKESLMCRDMHKP